ncbi:MULTISPECIES: hypothetical protein [Streptomyces]|nr:hypothetical protein [[Kitasatospora] papulosa]
MTIALEIPRGIGIGVGIGIVIGIHRATGWEEWSLLSALFSYLK